MAAPRQLSQCNVHTAALCSCCIWLHILQAEACKTGTLYMVNVISAQGSVLSEVAFNGETGCLGANTVQVGLVCSALQKHLVEALFRMPTRWQSWETANMVELNSSMLAGIATGH